MKNKGYVDNKHKILFAELIRGKDKYKCVCQGKEGYIMYVYLKLFTEFAQMVCYLLMNSVHSICKCGKTFYSFFQIDMIGMGGV